MKNLVMSVVMLVIMASCVKQSAIEEPSDRWNGYSKYLKAGEMIHTLWAGQNINVGTVTYGLDDDANFYVTYDCSASGWMISETHMFAGDRKDMPLTKPGAPKIGLFPNSSDHNPRVSTFTYRVPLSQLPPCESPGFVVAAHCIVHGPQGKTETAWAEGDFTFNDKGWGWYDTYYYNTQQYQQTILYGLITCHDSLNIYRIDINNDEIAVAIQEFVGDPTAEYDGAAYDIESSRFLFSNTDTRELWANQLTSEGPSFLTGILSGPAASATFYNGSYYYVNADLNSIVKVIFSTEGTIAGEIILDEIPGEVIINDIAMSPAGDYLYMIGRYNGGATELISWDVNSHAFFTTSISINEDAQIAYGSDGTLYAIATSDDGVTNASTYIIDTGSGVLNEIGGGIIMVEDPFSDLSEGPVM